MNGPNGDGEHDVGAVDYLAVVLDHRAHETVSRQQPHAVRGRPRVGRLPRVVHVGSLDEPTWPRHRAAQRRRAALRSRAARGGGPP
eukprot:3641581-Prymnesium_polylepis.1